MLNLLFISDSPRAEYIKSALQPVLKVIIDVVTDFDNGLKDVFEKRPSTVCIQDQIGGVTGESVARHIQMLLGDSAPTFILLYAGDNKPKVIKGLYEHLVDLGQSDDLVVEDIKNTLKSLLGDQWNKIYIPPKPVSAAVSLPVAVPEESQEEDDKLVDDFFSDLGSSKASFANAHPDVASTHDKVTVKPSDAPNTETPLKPEKSHGSAEEDRAQAINDDLAELLLMEVERIHRDQRAAAASSAVSVTPEEVVFTKPKREAAKPKQPSTAATKPHASQGTFPGTVPLERAPVSTAGFNDSTSVAAPVTASQTPPAAEFRISNNVDQMEEHIPDELLMAFEENYRSESLLSRRTVIIVLVCAVCAVGGWYLVKQKPQQLRLFQQRFLPSSWMKQSATTLPIAVPAPPVQKPVSAPVMPPAIISQLPSFIPKDGHDSSFALKNPGWERYVGKLNEFRVFSAQGRIQAVQVLAGKEAAISEPLIISVLKELLGNSKYQITSRTTKSGVRVDSGRIQNKGEVKFYRQNGFVKAFVVSVN